MVNELHRRHVTYPDYIHSMTTCVVIWGYDFLAVLSKSFVGGWPSQFIAKTVVMSDPVGLVIIRSQST